MAKSFKNNNATKAFISEKPEEELEIPTIENYTVPVGYRLVREPKRHRLQLLTTETTAENLKAAAAVEGISLNELCNRLFEEYLKGAN